jgi:hypothetical protein
MWITINEIGRWLIWLCVVSLLANGVACSLSGMHGMLNLKELLIWTYGTLALLIIVIFMTQYKPYNPEE